MSRISRFQRLGQNASKHFYQRASNNDTVTFHFGGAGQSADIKQGFEMFSVNHFLLQTCDRVLTRNETIVTTALTV